MKARIAFLAAVLVLGSGLAHAQGTDLVVAYSFGALEAGATTATNEASGYTVSFSKNFGPYFGWTTDYGQQFGNAEDLVLALSPLRSFTSLQLFTGPQINIRTKKWNVFFRALGGIVREDLDGFTVSTADCTTAGIDCSLIPDVIPLPDGSFSFPSTSVAKFAMNYGVGFDYYLVKHFGLRLVQLDYMPVRSSDPNRDWRQNVKYSAGLVIRF